MNTPPIQILYTHCAYVEQEAAEHRVPVVRYSDHCARVQALSEALDEKERLRANAVRRCDNLLKQLEQMALLCDTLSEQAQKPNPTVAIDHYTSRPLPVAAMGRWSNKKPSAL